MDHELKQIDILMRDLNSIANRMYKFDADERKRVAAYLRNRKGWVLDLFKE